MSKKFTIFIMTLGFALPLALPTHSVHAQTYKGDYKSTKKKSDKDLSAKPVPKIFSSQVSTVQAQKLDLIYNNLYVSLFNFSVIDTTYKNKLMSLLEPYRFKLTRYPQEFSGDLDAAMKNLNTNYKTMQNGINEAQEQYDALKADLKQSDIDTLDPLWISKLQDFKDASQTYFKMQNQFLNTYRGLVAFILKQGGSYYYKTGANRVFFYRFEGYKYYGQSMDKLNKINFEQSKFIQSKAPKNIDTSHR